MSEMIQISKITPAPFQPRKKFDETKMQELADSMKEQGLIQAITVRPLDGGYQLIAGERRFRAAKILGWKEIRAEVCPMDDMEAEEKSIVENVHRGDLGGEDLEDIVNDLWVKGNTETGNCRYGTKNNLSIKLGFAKGHAALLISSKEAREKLGLKNSVRVQTKIPTTDFIETMGIENDADRKKLIEQKADGQIGGREIRDYVKAVKDSPVAVKDAVLDKPKIFTPAVAAELSKLPEASQKGTIDAIKKGKMDEEDAIAFSKTVKDSSKVVQDAVMDKPKLFTTKVAAEISSLSTEEAQKSTIDAIKKFRLEEDESIQLSRMIEEQTAYAGEKEEEFAYGLAGILKQREHELANLSSPKFQRIGSAMQNVFSHMRMLGAIKGSAGNCTCPHCGKGASEYVRWTCCKEGRNETLEQAYLDAKKQHESIVKEETGKEVKWK